VPDVDARLTAALAVQLGHRRAALLGGAARVGWKLGLGERERIDGEPAVGHLTSATRLEPGGTYTAGGAESLFADAEVVVELGRRVAPDGDARGAIAGFGAALELVDLARPDDAEAIVAANVFHRAFSLSALRPSFPRDVEAKLMVNGAVCAAGPAPDDLPDRVRAAARALAAVGERLEPGDRVLTGSAVQVPVGPGDEVVADLGALGRVALVIGA
jgi:2-keto-4-pentenoate hydratase